MVLVVISGLFDEIMDEETISVEVGIIAEYELVDVQKTAP